MGVEPGGEGAAQVGAGGGFVVGGEGGLQVGEDGQQAGVFSAVAVLGEKAGFGHQRLFPREMGAEMVGQRGEGRGERAGRGGLGGGEQGQRLGVVVVHHRMTQGDQRRRIGQGLGAGPGGGIGGRGGVRGHAAGP